MGPMDIDRESRSPRDDDGHGTHTSSTTRAAHPTRIMSRSCAAPNSGQPFMSASTAGLPRGHGDQLVPPTSSTERTEGRHHRHRQRLEIPTSVLQLHAPRGTPGPAKEAIRRRLPPHHEQGREAAATSGEKKKRGDERADKWGPPPEND
jgi:hypothetical protein